jgi:hypothetical protein
MEVVENGDANVLSEGAREGYKKGSRGPGEVDQRVVGGLAVLLRVCECTRAGCGEVARGREGSALSLAARHKRVGQNGVRRELCAISTLVYRSASCVHGAQRRRKEKQNTPCSQRHPCCSDCHDIVRDI